MKQITSCTRLVGLFLVLFIGINACKKGEVGPAGIEGKQGVPGQKGDRGEKGAPGNANVLSTTYTFKRTDIIQGSGNAYLQIPAAHILEPANFDGAFMAYLTPIGAPIFGGFSAGVTLTLPFSWYNTPTACLASARVYRTVFNAYYLSVAYHGSTASTYPFLDSGEFALRLVWIPSAIVALNPDLDLTDSEQVINRFKLN